MSTINFSQIYVLGAGAIGSYYGSQLSKRLNVTLISREAHVNEVNEKGLNVTGTVQGVYKLKASTKLTTISKNALIIITTKAQDLKNTLIETKHLYNDDSTLLLLQNGHGNEEIAREIIGPNVPLARGLVTTGVNFLAPGMIDVKLANPTVIKDSPTGSAIAALFRICGLDVTLSNNMGYEIWRKLVLNCVINPLTALYKVPNKEIAVETLRGVINGIVDECRDVAAEEGVTLEHDMAETVYNTAAMYSNMSSMCQDIIKGKRTEIDFLNGRVSELGRRYDVATPVNDTLSVLIHYLEGRR